MVGSAIIRRLEREGYQYLVVRNPGELDLTKQADVHAFFASERPEFVFLAAAKVGDTEANLEQPADFLYANAMVGLNVIRASYVSGVRKLISLGDIWMYPGEAVQPVPEDALLTGPLEPAAEGYAVGKITAAKFCQYCNEQYGTDFMTLIAPALFGPGDRFSISGPNLVPALIRRLHDAQAHHLPQVTLWGGGTPLQEFMYVDDLADVVLFFARHCHARDAGPVVNVGTGEEVSVWDLADLVRDVVGYHGRVVFETGRPDEIPSRLMDVSRLRTLGWRAPTTLREGLEKTYAWFLEHVRDSRDES